jgi:hypothetical protein
MTIGLLAKGNISNRVEEERWNSFAYVKVVCE